MLRLEKYIISLLITNCAIFNTLAGCCNGKNSNKKSKGYSCKQRINNNNESTSDNIGSNNNEQQEQNPEDLKKKKEQEDKEKLKNPKEELIDESEKAGLLKIYNSLSSNIDNLINYNSNIFSVENINVKREEIENCKKTDFETVKDNMKNERNKFNKKINSIYTDLAKKYNKSTKKLDDNLEKNGKYNIEDLKKLKGEIDTQLQNVNINDINDINKYAGYINKIVENYKKFDVLINDLNAYLENDFNGYKNKKIEYFNTLKEKFNFANSEIKGFNYNLDEKIKDLKNLNKYEDINVLSNELESKDKEITEYIKKNIGSYNIMRYNNNCIILNLKDILDNFEKKELYEYLISKDIKDRIEDNQVTFEDIKIIKETVKKKDNFIKKDNLINFIKDKFKNKLDQYPIIPNGENRDINILNGLLICSLFKERIKDNDFFKEITDGKEIKDEILDTYEVQMDYYKDLMDENKVYISYDSYKSENDYIFAKTDKGNFIIEPYTPKIEHFSDERDDSYELKNENTSSYTKFKNKDKFNEIFKKDKEYKDIILLTDKKEYSYLCYCRPNKLSFHIVSVQNNYFNRLFSLYSAEEITILYNSPNVTDMSHMFSKCKYLKNLDLSKFDTSNVTNMSSMFEECTNLTNITFSDKFNTSNVKYMDCMFNECTKLTKLDLSKFNTSNVTAMGAMFCGCKNLENITFSDKFNTSNVEYMRCMFYDCTNLKELNLSNFNTSKVTDMYAMFNECTNLTELNLSNFNTSNVTNMEWMFKKCKNLKNIIFGNNFNNSNVTTMEYMFRECTNLTKLDLSNFNTSNVKNMRCMFYGCTYLENITFSDKFNTSNVESMSGMFYDCTNLKELNLSNFNTSKVTDMGCMFCGCKNLENITFSDNFNTSNVESMRCMFYNCENLKTLDISKFDLSKDSLNVEKMFYNCNNIEKKDIEDTFKKIKKDFDEKDLFETE